MNNKETFTTVIVSILIVMLHLTCANKKDASENVLNAQMFFNTLTKDGGKWVNQPNDSSIPFTDFIMKFKMNGTDTLIGRISGIHVNGDSISFWEVKEVIDYQNNTVFFEQTGSMGSARSISTFEGSAIRKCEFEIIYSDSTRDKHKDIHTIISEKEILTESEIYNSVKGEWVEQPSATWRKIK